jgi:8-oxo-dGTP diphosphatase
MIRSRGKHGKFVIRVYAIIINEGHEVLLSDEYMLDMKMTKFPGGGLQQGEGTIDCLKREAVEEFGQEIEVTAHFYTTDYYQESMFHKGRQLLSIYYLARFRSPIRFPISKRPFDFEEMKNGNQSFRWEKIDALKAEEMTFPIDRIVAEKLRLHYAC